MAFELPELPWAPNALEPHISAKTLGFHHGKHHAAYVAKLNELVAGSDLEGKTLEEVIAATTDKGGPVFNNAAQAWNHAFYWNSMTPGGGGEPTGEIAKKMQEAFGSYENFKTEFVGQGVGQFGSGWVWLVDGEEGLVVEKTSNAGLPLAHDRKALLTCDVWEHAYYLDFQNRRPDYLNVFLDHLINWDFANQNLS